MRLQHVWIAALLSCAGARAHDALDLITLRVRGPNNQTCSSEKAGVRKEWSQLSRPEKQNYIHALICLTSKPARTPAAIAPGAKNRYDDFVVTHIQQSLTIHGTANFLSWHRYYLQAFEDALRDECGYKGYQPYNNWALWAENPKTNPLFDGSDTSLSGDGDFVPERNDSCIPNNEICSLRIPPAQGGGCVTSGPLKNWKVNLGPLASLSTFAPPNPQADGLGFNPRCISRDINPYAANLTTQARVDDLLSASDIATFQGRMESVLSPDAGVHAGGHYTIGGDAGSDFFNSPSDPAFWFHHAMIDRLWWIWQSQDATRETAITGTITFNNQPPSREGTLEDILEMGYVGVPNITLYDAMSTKRGQFCYRYS